MARRSMFLIALSWFAADAPAVADKKQHDCVVVDVKRSDHVIHFRTQYMPDPRLNGRQAQLDVRRVRPVFARNDCRAEHAIVFMHGGSFEAVSDYDLRFKDYSMMEAAALAGIDAFTFNSLGFGGSSRFDGPHETENQYDPCNASLPACDFLPTTPPTCRPGIIGGVSGQQKLPHIMNFLDLAVDDAREKSRESACSDGRPAGPSSETISATTTRAPAPRSTTWEIRCGPSTRTARPGTSPPRRSRPGWGPT